MYVCMYVCMYVYTFAHGFYTVAWPPSLPDQCDRYLVCFGSINSLSCLLISVPSVIKGGQAWIEAWEIFERTTEKNKKG